MAARREEDLGGGRASWLVPFDVISRNTYKQPTRERGRRKTKEVGAKPPPKVPPRKVMRGGREEKGRQNGKKEERRNRRKKEVDERKK